MATTTEYIAISTVNAQASGWNVLARGTDKMIVHEQAWERLQAEHPGIGDIYGDTLRKNLRIVSKTTARRIAGRCALNECDHDHGIDA